jgi:hypothetical protein
MEHDGHLNGREPEASSSCYQSHRSEVHRIEALAKLKLILVMPEPPQAGRCTSSIQVDVQHRRQNLSQEWQVVKTNICSHATGNPSSGTALTLKDHHGLWTIMEHLSSSEYKRVFLGK